MVATAGVAFAIDGTSQGVGGEAAVDGLDHAGHDPNGVPGVESNDESDDPEGIEVDVSVNEGSGISGGVTISGSGQGVDVTETGVDAPPAPVEAPAVAASGPAPHAATAAPVIRPVVAVITATVRSPDAPGGGV